MNAYIWVIQLCESVQSQAQASEVLGALACQDGYLNGRVLPPSPSKPGWRIQAFFRDEPEACGWLPDGLRRVMAPERMLQP